MKRVTKILIFAVLALALCAAGVACVDEGASYTVTLELNGGAGIQVTDFISDGKLVEPESEPTRSGYVFAGWFFDKDLTEEAVFGGVIDDRITLYAAWEVKTSEARFVFGSWTEEVRVHAKDGKYAPPSKEREGYEFAAWYADPALRTEADFTSDAVDGAVFYAKWRIIDYTITYLTGGLSRPGINSKFTYTVEDAVNLFNPASVASGYEFLRWEDENGDEVFGIAKGGVGDRIFTAIYLNHNNYVEKVKGGKVEEQTVRLGVKHSVTEFDAASVITVSERAAFKLYDGAAEIEGAIALEVGDRTLRLTVTAESGETREYTVIVTRYPEGNKEVTFRYPGGTYESVFVATGDTAEPPTPKDIDGYEFVGWFADGDFSEEFDFATPIIEDCAVYAKYDATEYGIIYDAGIGENNPDNPAGYTIVSGADFLDAAAPDGYLFAGWFTSGGIPVTGIVPGSVEDVTVYARYEAVPVDALEGDYSADGQTVTAEEIPAYFDWAVISRLPKLEFTVTDDDFDPQIHLTVLNKLTVASAGVRVSYTVTGNAVTANFEYTYPNAPAAETDGYVQLGYYGHEEYTSDRSADYDGFKINSIDSVYMVSDSEQLFYAAAAGYRPQPVAGSAAERIYGRAKAALRAAVDDRMSDEEKAHAIYDWIILNVVYDRELFEMSAQTSELNGYNGFYLEGVFDDGRAVCDGISKAYALMCRIEGIACVQITGESLDGIGHAWNKVRLGGLWYVVDATSGGTILNGATEIVNHRHFLITDADMAERYTADSEEPIADAEYDYYNTQTFVFDGREYDAAADSRAELAVILRYFAVLVEEYGAGQTFDLRLDYAHSGVRDELSAASAGIGFGEGRTLQYITDGDAIILIVSNI